MKKLLSVLLSFSVVMLLVTSCSQQEAVNTSVVPMDTLMVGVQDMNGDFITGFGNNAYDASVKVLTGGYMNTYEIDANGEILLNTVVVKDMQTSLDNDGNKTYTFTLHDDIFWNNGDAITAKDYVASILWLSSAEWQEAGASTVGGDALVGYSDYREGLTDVFSGMELISDTEFSLTIAKEELPYYWEAVNVMVSPIHYDTYLPNSEIKSADKGVYLEFSEGDLLTNCMNIANTERYAPTVTCGPYSFVSFENQTVTLELNEHFKGDMYGNVPTLQYIVQKSIPTDTDVEWVISGEVDLVESVVQGEKIEAAKASQTTQFASYLRAGFGFLAMMCDEGPTADVNVRWALASLIDRTSVVDYVIGGYGTTVDAEYGLGQWMYQEKSAELSEKLMPISFNVQTANEYLDKTQWIYEADGTTSFDATKAMVDGSYLRHNENGEALVINHLAMDNVLTDIIEIQYSANAPLAGIQFNLDLGDWNSVLKNYYNAYSLGDERIYNTFSLATDFTAVFDRYYTWHSDFANTNLNKAQLSDDELDDLIIAMRTTDPEDKDAYLEAWVNYQVRFNELMPQVPLYSSEYYTIAHENLNNLNPTAYSGYENYICQITKTVNN